MSADKWWKLSDIPSKINILKKAYGEDYPRYQYREWEKLSESTKRLVKNKLLERGIIF